MGAPRGRPGRGALRAGRAALAVVAAVAGGTTAAGARFPDSVERTFAFRGGAAREVASLLGLSPGAPAAEWRLGPNDEWAALLREKPDPYVDGPRPAPPPRHVRAVLAGASGETVTLAGSWLDTTTGSSPRSPRYQAGSPFVADGEAGPWADLVRRLLPDGAGTAGPGPGSAPLAGREVREEGRVVFEVRVFRWRDGATGRTGFLVYLGAGPR